MYVTFPAPQRNELWVADIDGGNKLRLATGVSLATGNWASDNFHLAFYELGTGTGGKAYILGADGSGLRQLPWTRPIDSLVGSPDQKSVYVTDRESISFLASRSRFFQADLIAALSCSSLSFWSSVSADTRSVFCVSPLRERVVDFPQKRLDSLVVAIAANELESYFEKDARYQERLRLLSGPNDTDGKVRLIADFLRRNTRARDDSTRTVTYSDLNRVLRRHGFELRNPSGNYINVMRIEPAKPGRFLGIGARPERAIFLAQIGFPGWKDQVHKAALKRVREATNLTSQDGCDTKVFFEDAEPIAVLISEYAEPLKRLANK